MCEKQQTHTHTTRTHSKKIMQIKLNAIWESTRRPNFTHTHTHSRGTSTSVCLCVCDTSNCINAVFIHTHFQYYRQQLTELLTVVVVLVVVTVVLAVVAGLSYSFYRANLRVCKCECDGNTSAKQLTTDPLRARARNANADGDAAGAAVFINAETRREWREDRERSGEWEVARESLRESASEWSKRCLCVCVLFCTLVLINTDRAKRARERTLVQILLIANFCSHTCIVFAGPKQTKKQSTSGD